MNEWVGDKIISLTLLQGWETLNVNILEYHLGHDSDLHLRSLHFVLLLNGFWLRQF